MFCFTFLTLLMQIASGFNQKKCFSTFYIFLKGGDANPLQQIQKKFIKKPSSTYHNTLFLEEKMKKLALILALMLIPCTAFGLQMMDDSTMDGITGQSGVHIAFDDIQMFINIEKMAWIDCDGFTSEASIYGTCTGDAGALAISNFQIDVLNINAIVSSTVADDQGVQTSADNGAMPLYSTNCGMIPLFYDYGTGAAVGCYLGSTTDASTRAGLGLNNYISPAAAGGFRPAP